MTTDESAIGAVKQNLTRVASEVGSIMRVDIDTGEVTIAFAGAIARAFAQGMMHDNVLIEMSVPSNTGGSK